MKNKTKIVSMALCLGLLATGTVGTLTGCSGNSNTRSTGQYIDDKTLGRQVRSAMSNNSEYRFDQVNVDVYRGTCQLSGFVDTEAQKDKAGDLAKGVQGVTSVDNNITVRPAGNQP
ncbi:MAG TPA: BON domain-containing protein [Candidatus Acidoferrales bacterium]|jgi:osmotically-inducible protein OsmY|nr:BON domain-containing protein [Candidatus Acidoferrales bacterium]